jgi:hypothetical protein
MVFPLFYLFLVTPCLFCLRPLFPLTSTVRASISWLVGVVSFHWLLGSKSLASPQSIFCTVSLRQINTVYHNLIPDYVDKARILWSHPSSVFLPIILPFGNHSFILNPSSIWQLSPAKHDPFINMPFSVFNELRYFGEYLMYIFIIISTLF